MSDRMPYGADTIVVPFTIVPNQTSRREPAPETPSEEQTPATTPRPGGAEETAEA